MASIKDFTDAFIWGVSDSQWRLEHLPYWLVGPSSSEIRQVEKQFQEREQMKKLYKVFVVENEKKVHEVNKIAQTAQGAMFDAVKGLELDVSYDDLDVYALEIFVLKKKKCCE